MFKTKTVSFTAQTGKTNKEKKRKKKKERRRKEKKKQNKCLSNIPDWAMWAPIVSALVVVSSMQAKEKIY